MDFDKIKNIAKKRQVTLKELSDNIEMSEANFYKCIKRGSIETKHLEKIAKFLNVPVSYFFEETGKNDSSVTKIKSNNSNVPDCSEFLKEIEHLNKEIELKDEIIKLLKKQQK